MYSSSMPMPSKSFRGVTVYGEEGSGSSDQGRIGCNGRQCRRHYSYWSVADPFSTRPACFISARARIWPAPHVSVGLAAHQGYSAPIMDVADLLGRSARLEILRVAGP